MADQCSRCTELSKAADEILAKLVNLTRSQLEAFRTGNQTEFVRLDRELENTVGEKERRIGALREHRSEHGI